MIHQLLGFFVVIISLVCFLQGVTLTLMLETNGILFSIAQCSMSDSKLV
jgi:hypothetical protein